MTGYPFLSNVTDDYPYGDRAIDHTTERAYSKMCWTNGVFMTNNASTSLQVVPNSAMTVTIKAGGIHAEGVKKWLQNDLTVTLSAASTSLKRIDRIVARMDDSDSVRDVVFVVKEGVPSTTPVAADIVQESNYFEQVLADIVVKPNATEITAADITDQRFNSILCGMVIPAIPQPLVIDDIYQQFQSSLDQYMALVEAALDETEAGHLQNEINTTNSAVSAINTQLSTEQLILIQNNTRILDGSCVSDATYADYPYKIDVPVPGCNASYYPEVVLTADDTSSVFYGNAESGTNKVTLWCENNMWGAITIPTIALFKPREEA